MYYLSYQDNLLQIVSRKCIPWTVKWIADISPNGRFMGSGFLYNHECRTLILCQVCFNQGNSLHNLCTKCNCRHTIELLCCIFYSNCYNCHIAFGSPDLSSIHPHSFVYIIGQNQRCLISITQRHLAISNAFIVIGS